MTTTPTQIDLWLQAPSEHQNLEFKEAKNTFNREKLSAYCVAIANEGGGHLVLEITDKPAASGRCAVLPSPILPT